MEYTSPNNRSRVCVSQCCSHLFEEEEVDTHCTVQQQRRQEDLEEQEGGPHAQPHCQGIAEVVEVDDRGQQRKQGACRIDNEGNSRGAKQWVGDCEDGSCTARWSAIGVALIETGGSVAGGAGRITWCCVGTVSAARVLTRLHSLLDIMVADVQLPLLYDCSDSSWSTTFSVPVTPCRQDFDNDKPLPIKRVSSQCGH